MAEDKGTRISIADKLNRMYAEGYSPEDVARLTGPTVEAVNEWDRAEDSDRRVCVPGIPINSALAEIAGYCEQRRALGELFRKGFNRTAVARLVGVGVDSVRAWERAVKMARGRTRERLLELAHRPANQLALTESVPSCRRGNVSEEEKQRRVTAMREVGLWPIDERARQMRQLIEAAKSGGITAVELMELLGVSRRTFYDYLDPESTRLMPIETTKRLQRLRLVMRTDQQDTAVGVVRLPTPEERFNQASLVLFGEYYVVGFAPGDPIKERSLRILTEVTGYHMRTLRRYIPIRTDGRRVPRAVVKAFEDVACRFGTIVPANY